MPIHTTLTFGLLNPKRVKFEGPKFNWIGSMAGIHDIIGVWQTTGVKTVGDARTKVVNMGATGRGGNTFLDPVMANNLLGTKFKVIATESASPTTPTRSTSRSSAANSAAAPAAGKV